MNQRKKGKFIYGIHPVLEAIKEGNQLTKIMVDVDSRHPLLKEIMDLARKNEIPVQRVPEQRLNRITGKNHQGIIGIISEIEFYDITQILPEIFSKRELPFIVILDSVTDIRNMGAIARTCECAGVHAIVIPARGSAEINAETIKSSSGALLRIPVCRSANLIDTVNYLKESGLRVVAATEKVPQIYLKAPFRNPVAIVLGSEGKGISMPLLRACDVKVRIPMKGNINSLNVSVAAGILIYEVLRQRGELR